MISARDSYCDYWAPKEPSYGTVWQHCKFSISGAIPRMLLVGTVSDHSQDWQPHVLHMIVCTVTMPIAACPAVTWSLLTCIHTTSLCNLYNIVNVAMMGAWSGHTTTPPFRHLLSHDFQLGNCLQQEGLIDSSVSPVWINSGMPISNCVTLFPFLLSNSVFVAKFVVVCSHVILTAIWYDHTQLVAFTNSIIKNFTLTTLIFLTV
jgi:hypothetical protein